MNSGDSTMVKLVAAFMLAVVLAAHGQIKGPNVRSRNLRIPDGDRVSSEVMTVPVKAQEAFLLDTLYTNSRPCAARDRVDSNDAQGKIQGLVHTWVRLQQMPLFTRLFPEAWFYLLEFQLIDAVERHLLAVVNDRMFLMPQEFNVFLAAQRLRVDSANMLAMAEAFAVLAAHEDPPWYALNKFGQQTNGPRLVRIPGSRLLKTSDGPFPTLSEMSFRYAVRCTEQKPDRVVERLFLWVGQGKTVREWGFHFENGFFYSVEHIRTGWSWDPRYPPVDDSTDAGTLPCTLRISTVAPSNAWRDGFYYYVTVDSNMQPTGNQVEFKISGLQPNQSDVTVRVRRLDNQQLILDSLVAIGDSGTGTLLWSPAQVPLGRIKAQVRDRSSGDTSPPVWLFLEAKQTGMLRQADTNVYVTVHHTTETFGGNAAQGAAYARLCLLAYQNCWNRQVEDWHLADSCPGGLPVDTSHHHHVYITDTIESHRYHQGKVPASAGAHTTAYPPNRRLTWVRPDLRNWWPAYSCDSAVILSVLAHEFFHGVQLGLMSPNRIDEYGWAREGQATAVLSFQNQGEEFCAPGGRYYSTVANIQVPQVL